MRIGRRTVIGVVGCLTLSGCVGRVGTPGSRRWRTQFSGEYLSTRPHLTSQQVAVARPNGTLGLLDREDGSVLGSTARGGRWESAGTPPVPVGEQVVTVTDEVLAVDDTGTVVWSESLPEGEYATTASRPVVSGDALYVTTSAPELLRIDVAERSISRVGSDPLDARWWHPAGAVGRSGGTAGEVAVGTGTLRASLIDLDSGAVAWSRFVGLVPSSCRVGSSVVTQVAGGRSETATATATDSGESELELVRVDPATDTDQWRTAISGAQPTFAGLLADDALVVVTRTRTEESSATAPARVVVVDPESGAVRATRELPAGVTRSGAIHDGQAYLTTGDGRVVSVGPAGELRTRFAGAVSPASAPAVRDGLAVFGTDDAEMVAVELA
jgi:hypothetical protein